MLNQLGTLRRNRNRIVIAAVVAEHCYQRESNPVWEYVNYFGSNANAEGKKGKNLLYDWDDIAYSRCVYANVCFVCVVKFTFLPSPCFF